MWEGEYELGLRDVLDLAAWGQRKNTMTKKVTHIRQRVRKV
jgi:hypothetical protein